ASMAGATCPAISGSASSLTWRRSWPIRRSVRAWSPSVRCRAAARPRNSLPRSRISAPRSPPSTRRRASATRCVPKGGAGAFGTKEQRGGMAMRPMTIRGLVAAVLAGCALFAAAPRAQAQGWPQRPVKFVIPFGPGAGADIGARLIQEKLATRWGKPIVIENRPGGDSMIAIQTMLSANDDHTFLWGPSGNFTVHPYLYQKLPYDPDDLVPVARFSSTILGVGVPASMKIDTLADFVKRAGAAPGKFNSAAVAGITELAFDYFAHNAKITMTKVPYRDIVLAVNDLAEDRLQVYSASYAILRPQREAGRITVLAQMGRERAPSLPEILTGIEAGFPELEMDGNVGLFASKALSRQLRERIG